MKGHPTPTPMLWDRKELQGAEGGTWGGKGSTEGQVWGKMSPRVRLEPAGKGFECQMKASW